MFQDINKQSGAIAKVLLALGIVVLIGLGVAYLVVNSAKPKPKPTEIPTTPQAVYESTINDIRFVFLESTDLGKTLFAKNSLRPEWNKDIHTTERYIKVIVGAQNVAKENTLDRIWNLGDIIDSEGRHYVPLKRDKIGDWLPLVELCGDILKPSFEPTPCTKLYEVANVAKGLKVTVMHYKTTDNPKDALTEIIDIKLMANSN